jgi:hypothetical protein
LEFGLNGIFLGLNGIDFGGFVGLNALTLTPLNLQNQSHLIPKKSHLILIPIFFNLNKIIS